MKVKRQELETVIDRLQETYIMCCTGRSLLDVRRELNRAWASLQLILDREPKDPVDVVPIQDYPFPILDCMKENET